MQNTHHVVVAIVKVAEVIEAMEPVDAATGGQVVVLILVVKPAGEGAFS